jgi:hypothetical protein
MRVFKFSDSETHFVAARSEAEARACFRKTYDLEPDLEDATVTEVAREQWNSVPVRDDDDPKIRSLEDVVAGDADGPAYLACSSVW